MTRPPPKPDRAAREAAALRQNLLKRKDQARRRGQAPPAEHPDRAAGNETPLPDAAAPVDTEAGVL